MAGAVLFVAAVAGGAACTMLAWAHVRRVMHVARVDLVALAAALKRAPAGERVQALRERTAPGSWAHGLATELLAAQDEEAKVTAVNLALGEVEHELLRSASWPPAGLRLALYGGVLLAIAAYLCDSSQLKWALAILGAGGVAALGCFEAKRSSDGRSMGWCRRCWGLRKRARRRRRRGERHGGASADGGRERDLPTRGARHRRPPSRRNPGSLRAPFAAHVRQPIPFTFWVWLFWVNEIPEEFQELEYAGGSKEGEGGVSALGKVLPNRARN